MKDGTWRQRGNLAGGGGIVGTFRPDFAGLSLERLLQYHRPIFEDGHIDYEFYYRPGQSHVHPALDRLAFMLEPDGVRIHWITDGAFDRTSLSPANVFDEPENRRGPASLPLLPGAWNQLRLSLTGDVAQVILNGQLVYERTLEGTNQRKFGLFHYAGQTEARTRNMTWAGSWPREVPPIHRQELAGPGAEDLDEEREQLPAVFEHNFAEQGVSRDRFTIYRGDATLFTPSATGVHVARPAKAGYQNATLAPSLAVEGDFDITLSYSQLETAPGENGSSSVILIAVASDESKSEALMYRRHARRKGLDYQQFVFASDVKRDPNGDIRNYYKSSISESRSGRLRLSRRGEVMHYLSAEGDSPNFQVIDAQPFTPAPLAMDGIRLVLQTHTAGMTSVVWKHLSIRAERLSGSAFDDHSRMLAELNAERDAFGGRFSQDFTQSSPNEEQFDNWEQHVPLEASSQGLRVICRGNSRWVSAGLSPRVAVKGDFDISVDFDGVGFLDLSKSGQRSHVYLQLEFHDERKTQVAMLFRNNTDSANDVYAQHRALDDAGKMQSYRVRASSIESATGIRLARRGREYLFLYRDDASNTEHLLTRLELDSWDVPEGNIRLLLHSAGNGNDAQIFWKNVSIQADEISGNATAFVTEGP